MIDWITVGAQIVNFIILVVLLKIFLYDRVLKAMDDRRQSVQQQYDEADRAKSDAEQQAQELRRQREELESKRDELMQQARQNADEHRREKREQAEKDVRKQKQRWLDNLQNRRADFMADLRRRTADQLTELSTKVLADLADADLQQRVVDSFVRRAEDLDEDTRHELRETFAGQETVDIAAAFGLSDEQVGQIRGALQPLLEGNPDLSVAREDDLICGIEIRSGGHAVGWNIGEYVDRLAEDIRSVIDEQIRELREGDRDDDQSSGQNESDGEHAGRDRGKEAPAEEDDDEQ
jgi:F-type H+-transporting ATPase subunit b